MTESALAGELNENQALNLLHTLAAADPDYPKIAKQLAPLALLPLPSDEQAAIAHAMLEVLGQDPQRAPAMISLLNHPPPQHFEVDLLSAGLLVAVVFLLRTHIRFEGKFRDLAFTVEHKTADSQALSDLLNKLSSLLPTGNKG